MYQFPTKPLPAYAAPTPVALPSWMQKPQPLGPVGPVGPAVPTVLAQQTQYTAPKLTTAWTTQRKDCASTLSYTVGFGLGAFLLAMVLGIAIEFLFTTAKSLDVTTFKTLLFYSVICGFLVGIGAFAVHKFYCKS